MREHHLAMHRIFIGSPDSLNSCQTKFPHRQNTDFSLETFSSSSAANRSRIAAAQTIQFSLVEKFSLCRRSFYFKINLKKIVGGGVLGYEKKLASLQTSE